MRMAHQKEFDLVLILSGGVGLASYQAGAFEYLHREGGLQPSWVAGSSIGAVNAAILAGNKPDQRAQRLRELWNMDGIAETLQVADARPPWRHAANWLSALETRVAGSAGHFRPRLDYLPWQPFRSFYDLAPLRARLAKLVDFERLNGGEIRMSVATTDVATGDLVLFDTARGDRIGIDHLLASCGFLPEFAPVEIGGRLLGDGGLAANAPIEALRLQRPAADLLCFVLDLYARDGSRP